MSNFYHSLQGNWPALLGQLFHSGSFPSKRHMTRLITVSLWQDTKEQKKNLFQSLKTSKTFTSHCMQLPPDETALRQDAILSQRWRPPYHLCISKHPRVRTHAWDISSWQSCFPAFAKMIVAQLSAAVLRWLPGNWYCRRQVAALLKRDGVFEAAAYLIRMLKPETCMCCDETTAAPWWAFIFAALGMKTARWSKKR